MVGHWVDWWVDERVEKMAGKMDEWLVDVKEVLLA
jgi:hypothetical protein